MIQCYDYNLQKIFFLCQRIISFCLSVFLQTRELIEDLKSASGLEMQGGKIRLGADSKTLLRILCHRSDSEASQLLKKQFKLPKSSAQGEVFNTRKNSIIFLLELAFFDYPLWSTFNLVSLMYFIWCITVFLVDVITDFVYLLQCF